MRKTAFWQRCVIVLSGVLTVLLLWTMAVSPQGGSAPGTVSGSIPQRVAASAKERLAAVTEGIDGTRRIYRLSDRDLTAPKPDPRCYGTASDPAQLEQLLEDAGNLLAGQETLFSTQTPILEGSTVSYYLDETIFAVTWKQPLGDSVYTFSEVKIAHPSQIRRFLAGGSYGSGVLYTTTEMAESVNAVVASSGDYYGYRSFGIVVMDGQVYRSRGELLDTCYIDNNGDLLFTYAGEIATQEAAEAFVRENDVRFSLCFGPVMILDGELCVPNEYNSGEVRSAYARAALCQLGPLHYAVVTANAEKPFYSMPTMRQFAQQLYEQGIPTAYALDGGQTASIAMNNQLINQVSYGSQRRISDILYFATAVPEKAHTEVKP